MTAHVTCGTQSNGGEITVLPIHYGRLAAALSVQHAIQMRPPVTTILELVLGSLPGVPIRTLHLNATISSIVKSSSRGILVCVTIREGL